MTRSRISATSGTSQPAPGSRPAPPGQAVPAPDGVPVPPALVNDVLTGCKPTFPAYHATILDLAARGYLTAASHPDDIWLSWPAADAVPDTATLAGYEQLVLTDMSRRLAGTGSAPFRALADTCEKDEQKVWLPFTEALRAEARRRGLSQRHRPAWTSRPDQLTPYGIQLAARLAGEVAALSLPATQEMPTSTSAELGRRAVAVAAMIPGAVPGLSTPGGRRRTAMQTEAWSVFSGTWRLVKIPPPAGRTIPSSGVVSLAFAAWFAGVAIIFATKDATRIWSVPFVLIAVALGIRGMARLAATLSKPRRKAFAGQVIACWGDVFQDEDPYCVVDDGERAWTFTGVAATYGKLDDLVQVAMNPRTGRLVTLHVTERSRQDSLAPLPVPGLGTTHLPGSVASLVDAAEAELLVGPVRRTSDMPVLGGHGVLYRGENGLLHVMVVSGGIARLGTMVSRSAGTPLPGINAEFWLLNDGRTLAVRSADTVAKVVVSGRGASHRPELLTELAPKVAARLDSAGPGGAGLKTA